MKKTNYLKIIIYKIILISLSDMVSDIFPLQKNLCWILVAKNQI